MKNKGLIIFSVVVILMVCTKCKVYNPEKYYNKALTFSPFDAIIVPGMPYDTSLTDLAKDRIYWAKHLFDKGITKNIIFSGGAVYTKFMECKIMKLFAMELGIPEKNIFLDSTAKHSVENIYYSYYVGKYNGLNNLAVATDVYQAKLFKYFNRTMKKKTGADIKILPILIENINTKNEPLPEINPTSAIDENFYKPAETEGNWKKLKGTLAQNIDWENLPTPPGEKSEKF